MLEFPVFVAIGKAGTRISFPEKTYTKLGEPERLIFAEEGNRLYFKEDERGWKCSFRCKRSYIVAVGDRYGEFIGDRELQFDEDGTAFIEKE